MSGRIRSIKPEAHLDEDLWDAELEEPGLHLFRSFTGLWCQADREGRFEWRPRQLKAAILPYWDGDFSRVLDALATRGFIQRYVYGGRTFGVIPTFKRHQYINGKEPESKLPAPPESPSVSDTSRAADATSTGASREADAPFPSPSQSLPDPDPDPDARAPVPADPPGPFAMHHAWALSDDTRSGLLTELIPGWAIDALVPVARTHYASDQTDRRTSKDWNQAVAKWVRRDFRDPNRRPSQPAGAAEDPAVTARRAAAQAKLEARRAEAERLGREARERAAAEGRPDPLSSARALVLAAAGADPEGVPGAAQ